MGADLILTFGVNLDFDLYQAKKDLIRRGLTGRLLPVKRLLGEERASERVSPARAEG